jgi:dihydroorotate dehydrogenase
VRLTDLSSRLGLDAVFPYAECLTIDISSPNTKNLRELQGDAALDELLGT